MNLGVAIEGVRPAAEAGDLAASIERLGAAGVEHLIFSPIAAPGELEEQLGRLAEAAA
jgi:hypothetical protein